MTTPSSKPALPATFSLCIAGIVGFTLLGAALLVAAHGASPILTAGLGFAIGVALGYLVAAAQDCWRG